jgi:MFS family permease
MPLALRPSEPTRSALTNSLIRAAVTLWDAGRAPWRDKHFSPLFWRFYSAGFFFDFGFGMYFFLLSLYLASLHFSERSIGLVAGSLTLGSVVATVPTSFLVRRFGLRPMLIFCMIAAPVLSAIRLFVVWPPAQIALAFANGLALCSWVVCTPPAIARTTTAENRTTAFSLTFATGIGSGALAGIVGGYLPGWLERLGFVTQLATGMRWVLLLACTIAAIGLLPLRRLHFEQSEEAIDTQKIGSVNSFLRRFFITFAIWNIALGAFTPFSNLYLAREFNISLGHIGAIYSASQTLQVIAILAAPLLFRRIGTIGGVTCVQLATAVALFALARSHHVSMAVGSYLSLCCFQYMAGPGIYSLVMGRTPDTMRSTASAMQNIVSSLSQAGAAAVAGLLISGFGYSSLLIGAAAVATVASMLFFFLLKPSDQLESL